jgi:hypothetical protein
MGMTKNRLKYSASLAGASLAVLPLVLTSQAGHSPQLADRGTITGVLELVGGPAPGRSFPEPGTVTAHRHGVAIATVRTTRHGRYVLQLAPGRYRLTGRPRHTKVNCFTPHPVTVRADKTVKGINVICPVP